MLVKTKICAFCNKKIKHDANRCVHCGKFLLELKTPLIPKLTKICPFCKKEIDSEANRCIGCGNFLVGLKNSSLSKTSSPVYGNESSDSHDWIGLTLLYIGLLFIGYFGITYASNVIFGKITTNQYTEKVKTDFTQLLDRITNKAQTPSGRALATLLIQPQRKVRVTPGPVQTEPAVSGQRESVTEKRVSLSQFPKGTELRDDLGCQIAVMKNWGSKSYVIYQNGTEIYKCSNDGCLIQWRLNRMLQLIEDPNTPEPSRQALSLSYQALSADIRNYNNMVFQSNVIQQNKREQWQKNLFTTPNCRSIGSGYRKRLVCT